MRFGTPLPLRDYCVEGFGLSFCVFLLQHTSPWRAMRLGTLALRPFRQKLQEPGRPEGGRWCMVSVRPPDAFLEVIQGCPPKVEGGGGVFGLSPQLTKLSLSSFLGGSHSWGPASWINELDPRSSILLPTL